jgi:hypothetical protein
VRYRDDFLTVFPPKGYGQMLMLVGEEAASVVLPTPRSPCRDGDAAFVALEPRLGSLGLWLRIVPER